MTLYAHQAKGAELLARSPSFMLAWEMGTGKSRSALYAAKALFDKRKLDRVLVLAPASVCYAWREELAKLDREGFNHNLLRYDPKLRTFFVEKVGGNLNGKPEQHMPVAVVSYSLLPNERHRVAMERFLAGGKGALVCDESSFLKNRNAKQTKAAMALSGTACFRWLLSGTPICNSQLDLYAQGKVMAPRGGPLAGIDSFYHFEWKFGSMVPVSGKNGKPLRVVGRGANGRVGMQIVKQWVPDEEKLKELTRRFAPYVSRVKKEDCLDLPPKAYTVREVALDEETWRVYQELKKEAMLSLGDGSDARPEPNAGVRLLRLCQLTSGHVGLSSDGKDATEVIEEEGVDPSIVKNRWLGTAKDISSEKLDFIADAILQGELAAERALIIWCRWRRERERLRDMLLEQAAGKIVLCEIYGGQPKAQREEHLSLFQSLPNDFRRVMLAQQHAGGFGLNLTAASTAVYLSNDWSYSTRVQSEDRCHRIGQKSAVTYWDVLATGPKGQPTVDHKIREALEQKQNVAEWTTAQWREALGAE